jgi:glycerophosphoryl diester phosphodiesterase
MFFSVQDRRSPLIWAHRGCSSLAPENTLAAARKAHEAGAHGWELDVQLTADGQVIVQHDRGLLRVTDVRTHPVFAGRQPYVTARFTLDELQQLSTGEAFARYDRHGQIAAGRVTAAELDALRREPMPSLKEALALTRDLDMVVNVELKNLSGLPGAENFVERTVAVLDEMSMPARVLISSFNFEYLREIQRSRPQYATAALVAHPHPDPVALMRDLGASAYHPGHAMVDADLVRRIRRAGLHVNVWTVNSAERMRELADWGVSGIITDFPQHWRE